MTDATALDRRRLLQAGLAAAALSVPVVRGGPGRTSGLTAPGSLPTIADWEAVLGDVVTLVGDGFRLVAQVVDVRDTTPAVDPAAVGSSYSVLFDIPDVPATGHRVASVHADALTQPFPVVLNPVNGDGSWEFVVDTRQPLAATGATHG